MISARKQLKELDQMLDCAIAGEFENKSFDESQASKIAAKLHRYLASAKLKRGHLEAEQAQVHALISDISHQTKTPVANILLYTQLLAEQAELSAQSREFVAQISAAADKLSFLVDALVKSSRLESGVIEIHAERQDVYPLVHGAIEACRSKAQAKGVLLHGPEADAQIEARYDAKWCSEAVCNLLDNAIKYTPSGGEVEVSLHAYEMFSCIRIRDTGKGIAQADLPLIFTRFYRAADSAEAEGVGIGLYLAREIVQQCGGYIQVTSTLGEGSVFSIYLSKL